MKRAYYDVRHKISGMTLKEETLKLLREKLNAYSYFVVRAEDSLTAGRLNDAPHALTLDECDCECYRYIYRPLGDFKHERTCYVPESCETEYLILRERAREIIKKISRRGLHVEGWVLDHYEL